MNLSNTSGASQANQTSPLQHDYWIEMSLMALGDRRGNTELLPNAHREILPRWLLFDCFFIVVRTGRLHTCGVNILPWVHCSSSHRANFWADFWSGSAEGRGGSIRSAGNNMWGVKEGHAQWNSGEFWMPIEGNLDILAEWKMSLVEQWHPDGLSSHLLLPSKRTHGPKLHCHCSRHF